MINVNYPAPAFRIRTENGRDRIFDEIRRKWVVLTPEEWVRQNFISYLIQELKYPSPLIAIEKELMLGELKKRFDILVYDQQHHPWLMVECKAPEVKVTPDVLQQVLRYNISVPVPFLVLVNGNECRAFQREGNGLAELEQLPAFPGNG